MFAQLTHVGAEPIMRLAANVLLQSTIAVLCAWILSHGLCASSPAKRHTLWMSTLLFIAMLPWQGYIYRATIGTLSPESSVRDQTADVTAPATVPAADVALEVDASKARGGRRVTFASLVEVATDKALPDGPSSSQRSSALTRQRISGLLMVTWGVGVLIGMARLAHGVLLLHRVTRHASSCDATALRQLSDDICREIGLVRAPAIVVGDDVRGPLTVGLWRPQVILPRVALQLPAMGLKQVLLHEIAHVARRDAWIGALQRLLLILMWPQPLIRVASAQLNRAREELCDNVVLRSTTAESYANTLVSLAELCRMPRHVTLGLGLFSPKWKLEARVTGLFRDRRDSSLRSGRWLQLATGVSFVCLWWTGGYVSAVAAPATTQRSPSVDPGEKTNPPGENTTTRNATAVAAARASLARFMPISAHLFAELHGVDELLQQHLRFGRDSGQQMAPLVGQLLRTHLQAETLHELDFPIELLCTEPTRSLAVARWVARDTPMWAVVVLSGDRAAERDAPSLRTLDGQFRKLYGRKPMRSHEQEIAGVPVRIYELPSEVRYYAFVFGRRLYITNKKQGVAELIGCAGDGLSLDSDSAFAKLRRRALARADDNAKLFWFRRRPATLLRWRGTRHPWDQIDDAGGVVAFPRGKDAIARHRTQVKLADPFLRDFNQGIHLLSKGDFTPESWVPADVTGYGTLHWDMKHAIPTVTRIVDQIVDSQGFCEDVLESFRSDPNGPQVDLERDLFAHLGLRLSIASGIDGDPQRHVAAIHVTDAAAVRQTILRLFRNDPQAEPPETVPGGFTIRLLGERTDTNDIKVGSTGRSESEPGPLGPASAIGVIDDQILAATDHDALRRMIENRDAQAALMDNPSFSKLARSAAHEWKLASGRLFLLGQEPTLPPFLSKIRRLLQRETFSRLGAGAALPLIKPQQATALSVSSTADGLVIEGVVLSTAIAPEAADASRP